MNRNPKEIILSNYPGFALLLVEQRPERKTGSFRETGGLALKASGELMQEITISGISRESNTAPLQKGP